MYVYTAALTIDRVDSCQRELRSKFELIPEEVFFDFFIDMIAYNMK